MPGRLLRRRGFSGDMVLSRWNGKPVPERGGDGLPGGWWFDRPAVRLGVGRQAIGQCSGTPSDVTPTGNGSRPAQSNLADGEGRPGSGASAGQVCGLDARGAVTGD